MAIRSSLPAHAMLLTAQPHSITPRLIANRLEQLAPTGTIQAKWLEIALGQATQSAKGHGTAGAYTSGGSL